MAKTRDDRKRELQAMVSTSDGIAAIEKLWLKAKGLGPGNAAPIGTLVRAEMIPDILKYEYPND